MQSPLVGNNNLGGIAHSSTCIDHTPDEVDVFAGQHSFVETTHISECGHLAHHHGRGHVTHASAMADWAGTMPHVEWSRPTS
jgi:hypothetical protein